MPQKSRRRRAHCQCPRTAQTAKATSAFAPPLTSSIPGRQTLEAKGIAIEADFEWPGGGRSIYFRDPAGNCLEFAEPRIWGLA